MMMTNITSYIIGVLLTVIIHLLEFIATDENSTLTTLYEIQLLVIYCYAQIESIRKFGLFNLFTLILVGFFLFTIGGIFHFLLNKDSILDLTGTGFGEFHFSNTIIQRSLLLYSLFLTLVYITYSKNYRTLHVKNKKNCINEIKHSEQYQKIGKIVMWFFLPIQLYKGYLYYTTFSLDTALLYISGSVSSPLPSWVRFLATFFEMGYGFILCSHPNRNIFIKYSLLFFIVLVPDIMMGNRGMFGAFILFFLWFYSLNYNAKPIKTKYAFVLAGIMLFVFQAMQFYRDGEDLGAVSYSLTLLLKGQAVSFYILPLYMIYSDSVQFYLYPYILYPIIGTLTNVSGQSLDVLQHKCGIGHQLIYAIDPEYYLSGGSFGFNSIVELYDLGFLGLIVGAIFFPKMILYFEKRVKTNRFVVFISYQIFVTFVLFARGSYFPSLYLIIKYYIFYTFILWCFNYISKNEKSSDFVRR